VSDPALTAREAGPAEPATSAGGAKVALSIEGAAVSLGGRTIWEQVDIRVREGEFVAILGPNGAGKSTLLKVILGLQPLAAGRARALGADAGSANEQIGYLPQRRTFDAATRIRGVDIVRLGLDGARWGLPLPGRLGGSARRAAGARVREVIDLVGAGDYARRPIGELSGGEQQRLLIAQALVRRPRMLILDEPLDSLDLANQSAVAALVQRVCRDEGVAVLLVGHDVNPLLEYLDRVIYVAGGRAVEGTVGEVINSETLSRLYGTPIEVLTARDGRLVVVGQPEAPFHHGHRHDHDHGDSHSHG
jgi:zinc/manganese transport system ATP-binding protein